MADKAHNFLWFIENYSYCWHKLNEKLTSPVFTIKYYSDNTAWTVSLFPREEFLPIQLDRSEDDGPDLISVTYVLTIVSKDGSTLEFEEIDFFDKKESSRKFHMLKEGDIFSKIDEYLPKDILTVRCRLSFDDIDSHSVETICARTRIGVGSISFCQAVKHFSSFRQNQTETYQIYSHLHKGDAEFRVYISDASCCEKKIMVEITLADPSQIIAKCKLYLLDSSRKKIKCAEVDNRFRFDRKGILTLPLPLTKDAIMQKKSEYLPGDKLSFLCECVFSTGIEFQKIEGYQGERTSNFEKVVSFESPVHRSDIFKEKLSACPSALDDLNGIFSNNFLTDVTLITTTNSFPAHKVLLCARSPVFKVMLSADMQEGNSGFIPIDDLEDETVKHLLHFLYSDNLEDLQWEIAIKLYYAADKYVIEKLRLICSSFLVDNLTASTATELLELADTHSDKQLKKVVENFILEHNDEVFVSNGWEGLMEKNPQLAIKTIHLMYETKKSK